MTDPVTVPEVDSEWKDAAGRRLVVREVVPDDPNGREVRGDLFQPNPTRSKSGKEESDRYTTTLAVWALLWRDKQPRARLAGMSIESGGT